jgi:hypothetical protein
LTCDPRGDGPRYPVEQERFFERLLSIDGKDLNHALDKIEKEAFSKGWKEGYKCCEQEYDHI